MPHRVKREIDREGWDEYYRRYQAILARKYLIPLLSKWNVPVDGQHLLDVGCGDGGCAAEFWRCGCKVSMMDIDQRLIDVAQALNAKEGVNANAFVGDVMDASSPFYKEGPFDIVLFRDVVEHLERPVDALRVVKQHLAPDGVILVVFPPYYSPYGAHQQILPRKRLGFLPYNKLPYLQMWPNWMFDRIIAGEGSAAAEVARIRKIRLTIGRFEQHAEAAGFNIREEKFYLSRPTFALRYGIPVAEARILGKIPLVREVLVTAAYYLLEPKAT